MLTLKLIGVIILSVTGLLSGKALVERLKKRADKLDWYYKAVLQIGNSIGGTANEISSIIKSISGYSDYLTLRFPFALEINKEHLKSEEILSITEFFEGIGNSEVEAEVERCKMYANIIREHYLSAKNEYNQKNKLYKMLGLFSGLSIAIIIM